MTLEIIKIQSLNDICGVRSQILESSSSYNPGWASEMLAYLTLTSDLFYT